MCWLHVGEKSLWVKGRTILAVGARRPCRNPSRGSLAQSFRWSMGFPRQQKFRFAAEAPGPDDSAQLLGFERDSPWAFFLWRAAPTPKWKENRAMTRANRSLRVVFWFFRRVSGACFFVHHRNFSPHSKG